MLSLSFEGAGAAADSLAHITLTGVACVVYLAIVATIVGWAIWGYLLGRYSRAPRRGRLRGGCSRSRRERRSEHAQEVRVRDERQLRLRPSERAQVVEHER